MGNTSSSSGRGHHEESVDYGSLVPQGVYTGPRDWNHAIVSQLIVSRKLAPFYRPLDDYNESWDDDQILAARKELPSHPENDHPARSESIPHSLSSKSSHSKRSASNKEPARPEAAIYRSAVECPICFLYYPPNINHSRCCDQAICTECFVQIKRNEPTTTHLVSEPAACPYCVQENFGVVYNPPSWRAGIGGDGSNVQPELSRQSSPQSPTHKRRQKSFSADSPEVVTTDQIRPDWEAKLAAVRAAVTRRANRRIIMRQVGDRLIPVGVTSGRVHALSPEEAAAEAAEGGGSRRRRRHGGNSQLEQFMGMPGQDLEELMLMEAMRLSLLDHEEQQRKQAEERRKQEAEAAAAGKSGEGGTSNESSQNSQTIATPSLSVSESHLTPQPSSTPIPSSSQTSLAPTSASQASRQGEESSDTGQRKPLQPISRSRTPPPPSNYESRNGESSSLAQRSLNPPRFSTLNAALASASTAAAILGSQGRQENHADSRRDTSTANNNTVTPAIPTVRTYPNGPNHDLNQLLPTTSPDDNSERPPLPPKSLPPSDLPDSSGNSGYGQLPSSPDSDIMNEPLLGSNKKTSAESDYTTMNGVTSPDDRSPSTASG